MSVPGHQHEPVGGHCAERLHECASCDSQLVYPIDWEQTGPRHWTVLRRCPNCEAVTAGKYEQAAVDAYDYELDHGAEALMRDLDRLARANMAEDVDRFVQALKVDAILPEDF